MSTYNLCFRAKIRKIGITLYTPVSLYKSGVCGGYILHCHAILMSFFIVINDGTHIYSVYNLL